MPRFLDVHPMQGIDEQTLKKAQKQPPDEFGFKVENILYNIEADKIFCILNSPNKEAVEKHHNKIGYKCEWIIEIKTIG